MRFRGQARVDLWTKRAGRAPLQRAPASLVLTLRHAPDPPHSKTLTEDKRDALCAALKVLLAPAHRWHRRQCSGACTAPPPASFPAPNPFTPSLRPCRRTNAWAGEWTS